MEIQKCLKICKVEKPNSAGRNPQPKSGVIIVAKSKPVKDIELSEDIKKIIGKKDESVNNPKPKAIPKPKKIDITFKGNMTRKESKKLLLPI
jgi:hypothetical protein